MGRSRHRHHEEEETTPAQQEADRRCAALTPSRIGTLLNSLMYIRRQFPAWSQYALGLLRPSPHCCCCLACLRAEARMGGRPSDSVPSGFMDAVEAAFYGCLQRALAAVATKVRDQPAEPASAARSTRQQLGSVVQEALDCALAASCMYMLASCTDHWLRMLGGVPRPAVTAATGPVPLPG